MDSRAVLRRPKTLERTKTRPSHKQFRSMHMLAWSSLLLAVGVLLSAIILVPRGVSSILAGVSESKATTAEIIDGTVLFQPPATANWQSMPAQKNLQNIFFENYDYNEINELKNLGFNIRKNVKGHAL